MQVYTVCASSMYSTALSNCVMYEYYNRLTDSPMGSDHGCELIPIPYPYHTEGKPYGNSHTHGSPASHQMTRENFSVRKSSKLTRMPAMNERMHGWLRAQRVQKLTLMMHIPVRDAHSISTISPQLLRTQGASRVWRFCSTAGPCTQTG